MKDEAFPDNRRGVRGNQGERSEDKGQEYQSTASSADAVVRKEKPQRDWRNTERAPDECESDVPSVSGAGIRGIRTEQVRIPLPASE